MSEIGVPQLVIEGMLLPGATRKRGRPRIKRQEINRSEWVSRKKAAKMLNVDQEQLTSLIADGSLSVIIHGKRLLVNLDSIGKYKEKHPFLVIKPKKKRGRPPNPKPVLLVRRERKKKVPVLDFVPIEQAEATLGISHEEALFLISRGKLTPAIKRASFFVRINASVDSCREALSEMKKARIAKSVTSDPVPEKKSIPARLTSKDTVSSIWTSDRRRIRDSSNVPKRLPDPDNIPLEPIEYEPGKMGYEAESLAPLMKLNPVTLKAWLAGFKVEGKMFPDGRAYIERESLRRWLIRTTPRD